MKRILFLLIAMFFILTGCSGTSIAPSNNSSISSVSEADSGISEIPDTQTITSFVHKSGNQMVVDGEIFRFSGANVPYFSDSYVDSEARRIMDGIVRSAGEMGLTVLRPWCMMFQGDGPSWAPGASLMPELDVFRDSSFDTIDYFLKICNENGIRVQFMLTGQDVGYGAQWFVKWRGLTDYDEFYTNRTLIEDYKRYLKGVLNHTNRYTNVKYKDDPTILFWEIGEETWNETVDWAEEIAAYIKSIDTNHLVMDGDSKIAMKGKSAPSIDIVSRHYYPCFGVEHEWNLEEDARIAKEYNKIFIVNEWDWIGWRTGNLDTQSLADSIYNNPDVAGDTWFQFAGDDLDTVPMYFDTQNWFAWFPSPDSDRQKRLLILRDHAFKMSGIATPEYSGVVNYCYAPGVSVTSDLMSYAGNPVENIIDYTQAKWLVTNVPKSGVTAEINLGQSVVMTRIEIDYANQGYCSFVVSVSNDNIEWILVDRKEHVKGNENYSFQHNSYTGAYMIDLNGEYQYVKIQFIPDYAGGDIAVTEVQVFGQTPD